MLGLNDIILTPIYLIFIYGMAYQFSSGFTNKTTKPYFQIALSLKLLGAIAFGMVYEFYYGGGDTYQYFEHSKVITNAFLDSPSLGFKLLFSQGEYDPETKIYATQMRWYASSTEFFIVKIAGFLGVICFKTYTPIALFFAFISFTGLWAMYVTLLKLYPNLHKQFLIAIFYLPSVVFWGSGLMKDSITIGALGWLFYGFYQTFIEKKPFLQSFAVTLVAAYVVYSVKVYVLLSFLPPALFWIINENGRHIKNSLLRNSLKPFFITVGLGIAYFSATNLTEGDKRYDINNIGERTKINSEYLTSAFVATGSAYNIGTFDGSIGSMVKVAPQAIIVSLFRPFLWEVKNPFMLLSALESFIFLYLTLFLIFKTGLINSIKLVFTTPLITFCIIFSLVLAFAVGTNSGNFGTLVRYKIPLMPFYLSALYIMRYFYNTKKRPRKVSRLAVTV